MSRESPDAPNDMSVLIIRRREIRSLLSMRECIDVMDRAMRAASTGAVDAPARTIAPLGDGSNFFILMPGAMREPHVYGAKIVGLHPGNPARGRPAVQGFVTLFDGASGAPVALMDGAEITAIRTAAASALATRVLARGGAASHGILGAGVQAGAHLDAVSCVRDISQVVVWGRDENKARGFAEEQAARTGLNVRSTTDPSKAAGCDVVSVVTNSPTPVLRGEWLRPGTHVNLVGAHEPHHREADTNAVSKSAIYVDSRAGALREAGDILIPIAEGIIGEADIAGEIGEVLEGTAPGRLDEDQVSLYKSLGIVAQDLFAAEQVYRLARASGAGLRVDLLDP